MEFPGAGARPEHRFHFWENGTLDGIVTRVGGRRLDIHWVPVRLEDQGEVIACEALKPVAKGIGQHLFGEAIRATGRARWRLADLNGLTLDRFQILSFERLDAAPLRGVVRELRLVHVNSDWPEVDDPFGEITQSLREEA